MEDDLAWENAGAAIFGRTTPDLRPLVELLRGERPIPAGMRHMLAMMMDPDGDGYLHFQLKLDSLESKRRGIVEDLASMSIAADYYRRKESGKTSEVAAEETGEKFGIDSRTVYRRVERWKEFKRFLTNSPPDAK